MNNRVQEKEEYIKISLVGDVDFVEKIHFGLV